MNIEKAVRELTAEEKAAIIAGTNFMYTNEVPRLGIPAMSMADGPHGLRKQTGKADNGVSESEPATAFPTAAALASGWNGENARKIGAAIAAECRHYGVHMLLGPGANIKRNPLCGRNFEYFSEDPLLAGAMAAAETEGIQSGGVGACVKHFALNNSENYRFAGNSLADARAVREIYLKVFECIVREAKPAAVMSAYNKVNGEFCAQNKWLLTEVLRGEWGFDGLVMTDWGGMHDRPASLAAGLDLEMPGDTAYCRRAVLDGLRQGTLAPEALDAAVRNILRAVGRYVCGNGENSASHAAPSAGEEEDAGIVEAGSSAAQAAPSAGEKECPRIAEEVRTDFAAHDALAARIAEDCAVLLQNDGLLPLSKAKKILAAGELFENMRYQGAGSSMINPTKVTPPRAAFDAMGISYAYARGYDAEEEKVRPRLIAEAVGAARCCDAVLVFAGLTDAAESEGCDRPHMRLAENQCALIDALVRTGRPVAVVLFGGAPVELPFAESVNAVLNMYLPGQNGGTAAARLLFGEANPAGRLAETWPLRYEDVPFGGAFGKNTCEVYAESVYVGYRYYTSAGKKVRYPFGFGLSYTSFACENLSVAEEGGRVFARCTVANTGARAGAEVVQLYVAPPPGGLIPVRELRAFQKVWLAPGERRSVELSFEKGDLRVWHAAAGVWAMRPGEYEVQICSDCETVLLREKIRIAGAAVPPLYEESVLAAYAPERLCAASPGDFKRMSGLAVPPEPPVRPLHMLSRFSDFRTAFWGRILRFFVLFAAARRGRRAKRLPSGTKKQNVRKGALFLRRVMDSCTPVSMSMTAGKMLPYNAAQGLVHLANGRLCRAIKCFCKRIEGPPPQREASGCGKKRRGKRPRT